MNHLPLIVLAYPGPMARAYLSMFKMSGVVPEKIIYLLFEKDLATNKAVRFASMLPRVLKQKYLFALNEQRMNYWSRWLFIKERAIYESISSYVIAEFGISGEIYSAILATDFKYENFSCDVDYIFIDSFKDARVVNELAKLSNKKILFTGGGILPDEIIMLKGINFLHFHPGILPFIRGADGLLWSILLRGNPGVSCFYLASGIDTGRVLTTQEFPLPKFRGNVFSTLSGDAIYRALYCFYDPVIRSVTLGKMLQAPGMFDSSAACQRLDIGETYRFMHPVLRAKVYGKIFHNCEL